MIIQFVGGGEGFEFSIKVTWTKLGAFFKALVMMIIIAAGLLASVWVAPEVVHLRQALGQ